MAGHPTPSYKGEIERTGFKEEAKTDSLVEEQQSNYTVRLRAWQALAEVGETNASCKIHPSTHMIEAA